MFASRINHIVVLVIALGTLAAGGSLEDGSGTKCTAANQPDGPAPVVEPAGKPKLDVDKSAPCDRYGDPLPLHAVARMGTVRWRLDRELVHWLDFSPDGKRLVTLDGYRGWSIWDAATGRRLQHAPPDADLLRDRRRSGTSC